MSDRFDQQRIMVSDTVEVYERLLEFYEPEEATAWMKAPHPQLEGKSAIDVIATCGGRNVMDILDRLDSAGYL